jgi:hypothetical protein
MILFVLSTIGLTNVLVHGAIFDDQHLKVKSWIKSRLGKYSDLLDCYECTGWWAGLIMGLTLVSHHFTIFIPCAFAGAMLGNLYSLLTMYIESNTAYEVSEDSDESGRNG